MKQTVFLPLLSPYLPTPQSKIIILEATSFSPMAFKHFFFSRIHFKIMFQKKNKNNVSNLLAFYTAPFDINVTSREVKQQFMLMFLAACQALTLKFCLAWKKEETPNIYGYLALLWYNLQEFHITNVFNHVMEAPVSR